jgi:hypothetical protein
MTRSSQRWWHGFGWGFAAGLFAVVAYIFLAGLMIEVMP